MINQPDDDRVWQAMHRLSIQPDWQVVRAWLEKELAEVSKRNDEEIEDVMLRQGQGGAKTLRRFFEYLDSAKDALKRIQQSQTR